ncbi:MAG: hypothetical protein ABIO73_13575 [Polaromonas sp.]
MKGFLGCPDWAFIGFEIENDCQLKAVAGLVARAKPLSADA